ncbi:MAG: hypothetical protein L3K18_02775 [Thermoplasmata archaeon]|nr:hypothetical protein [Thermoplasmata archaeon]
MIEAISDFPTSTGSDPEALVIDPIHSMLWVANQGAGITEISLKNDTLVKRIPLVAGADGITYDPVNRLVYAVGFDGNLTVVNTTTQMVVGTQAVGAGCAQSLAFDPASNSIYVGGGGCGGGALVVNPINLSIAARIPSPWSAGLDSYAVSYDPFANVMVLPSETSGNVSFVNATTNTLLASVTVASTLGFEMSVAINPARKEIYIAPGGLTDGSGIAVLNATSLAYIAEIPGRFGTPSLQYEPSQNRLFAVDENSGTIAWVNGTTDLLVGPPLPLKTPYHGAMYDAGSGAVYIATNDPYNDCGAPGSLTVLDPTTHPTIVGSVRTGDGPQQIAVDPLTHRVYTTNLCSNSVSVIDDRNNSVVNLSVPVGAGPEGIAVASDTGLVYVSDVYDSSIWTINQSTLVSSRLLNFSNYSQPAALAYDSVDHRMFVALYGASNVSVINTSSNALLPTTIPVGFNPQGLLYDATNGQLYVACSASGNVSIVNASTMKILGSVAADAGPVALALDGAAQVLYVANLNSGTVDMINTSSDTRIPGYVRVLTAPLGIVYAPATNQLDVMDENYGVVSVLANAPQVASVVSTPSPTEPGVRTYLTGQVVNGTAPYSYSVANAPPGCGLTGAFDMTCVIQTPGAYRIFFNASDSFGYPAWTILRFYVNASFGLVGLRAIQPVLDLGQPLDLRLNASGGTTPLSIEYFGLPTGCVTDDSPVVDCKPSSIGTFNVTALVTDAIGGSIQASTQVTVNAALAILAFASNPSVTFPGTPVDLSVITTGGSAPLSYSSVGLPPGCTSANASVLACTPSSLGNASIMVTVTDAVNESASATTTLVLAPRPTLGLDFSVFPTKITVGSPAEFTATATNVSGGANFAYVGLPPGCSGASLAVLVCTPNAAGNFSVTMTVTDGLGRTASSAATLEVVKAVPEPPGNSSVGSNGGPSWGTALALLVAAVAGGAIAGAAVMWVASRTRKRPPDLGAGDRPKAARDVGSQR